MSDVKTDEFSPERLQYLKLLSNSFPNVQSASTEIINLQAVLELPKGTEHFISDIHGEAEAFLHIMNNCSGNIKNKLRILFANELSEEDISNLATLIYYPERKMKLELENIANPNEWYYDNLTRIVKLARLCASKYSRSKLNKTLPKDFDYIINELLTLDLNDPNKQMFFEKVLHSIVDIDRAPSFIIAMCGLIKRLITDSLHILGDLFDRGEHPDIIIETLMNHHSVDIQWGNHDCLWMGAASGSGACIANVLNNALKYANLDVIEDFYGINLLPLARFANTTYSDNSVYYPKAENLDEYSMNSFPLIGKMRKAINVIMYKMEGKIIKRHPEFNMDDRLLLDKINYKDKTIEIEGVVYPMKDTDFPTINKDDPYTLSYEEGQVMEKLIHSFTHSPKLRDHIKFIYEKGSIYKSVNNNLLFHGNIPTNDDGSFMEFNFNGKSYSGKALLDYCDMIARQGFYSPLGSDEKRFGEDFLWWLWQGKDAPTCGRKKVTTFERVFIEDKNTHEEPKNAYYDYQYKEEYCNKIFKEFNINPDELCHIINGHIPVETKKGESPVRANGKLIAIDGGFCSAYQGKTGIAGYTMFYNSWGIRLAKHAPFKGEENAIRNNQDITSTTVVYESADHRLRIKDTDEGKELQNRIFYLKELLKAYRSGIITPRK